MRSIPQVVLAFILVWPFGIGPLAGILAIGIHSTGALGKLFSEVNENADMRPVEGMRAAGGNWLEAVRYGLVPQVLPGFLSYALLRFEINVRVFHHHRLCRRRWHRAGIQAGDRFQYL